MIPNIFISSTIADLHYLRNGLKEAIKELEYNPVMSEHDGVGYLRPATAVESCYRSVEECQMVVLIIGKRYSPDKNGRLSVTHNEYKAAKEKQIPTITFVEKQVLHYKEVFDASAGSDLWHDFDRMDSPRQTFEFLDEIGCHDRFNAIVPFDSVTSAKTSLKKHLASFVGEQLRGLTGSINNNIQEILAEIKTLRSQLNNKPEKPGHREYFVATKFLLQNRTAAYKNFLERLFGTLDDAIDIVLSSKNLESVIQKSRFEHKVVDAVGTNNVSIKGANGSKIFGATSRYIARKDDTMDISHRTFDVFDAFQKEIHAEVSQLAGSPLEQISS